MLLATPLAVGFLPTLSVRFARQHIPSAWSETIYGYQNPLNRCR